MSRRVETDSSDYLWWWVGYEDMGIMARVLTDDASTYKLLDCRRGRWTAVTGKRKGVACASTA